MRAIFSFHPASRLPTLLLIAGATGMLAGCVQRRIHITSEPAGALVHLNDEEVGRTPVSVGFTWYGTYDVRLEADGHRPLWVHQKNPAPLMEYPGLDLIFEAIPGSRVDRRWHYQLSPLPASEAKDVVVRAEALRIELRQASEPEADKNRKIP